MDPMIVVGGAMMCVMMTAMGILAMSCFRKCGPNEAMIVSGLGTARGGLPYTIVKGGSCIVLPLVQQRVLISLELVSVDLKGTPSAESHDGITVSAEGTLLVKVGGDDASISRAAEALLNKSHKEWGEIAKQIVGAALQESLIGIKLKETGTDMTAVRDKAKSLTVEKLKELGLTVNSFSLILQPAGYSASLSSHS